MSFEDNPMLKIHKFMFLADKFLDRELHSHFEISFSQFRVISIINHKPGISQKQVARTQETTEAAVSRHIDVLEKMNYVALTTNSNNRKEHNLYLTKRGQKLFGKTFIFVEKKAEALLGKIDKIKRSELEKTLDVLLSTVREECGDDPFC